MSFLYSSIVVSTNESEQDFLESVPGIIADKNIEYLIIGYFDNQSRLLHIGEVCSDLIDVVLVPVRKIAHEALNLNAHSIMLMHNHPSGDPKPSQEDIKQTRDIARILSPLGIFIDDHLIVAGDHQFSFRKAGLL
jgi:DNA repair protein RadC